MEEELKEEFESAITSGDTRLLDTLAKDFDSFTAKDKQWLLMRTLSAAANTDLIQHVLDLGYGMDYTSENGDGETLLHLAAKCGNPKIVRFFIERGLDMNKQDLWGWTPIHAAAKETRSVEVLKTLIEAGADTTAIAERHYINNFHEEDLNLLHIAAGNNPELAITKFFLEQGFDLESRAGSDFTPLLLAARHQRNVEVISFLVEEGANVFARSSSCENLLSCAAVNPSSDVMRYVLSMFSVRQFDDENCVSRVASEELLKDTLSIDEFNKDGYAAFENAVSHGTAETVSMLLHALRSEILRLAVENKNPGILDALLRAGYDANTADPDGITVMMWAASHHHGTPDTIATLRKYGAQWNAVDSKGRNVLHYAAHDHINSALYEWMLADNDFKTLAGKKDSRGHTPEFYRMNGHGFY